MVIEEVSWSKTILGLFSLISHLQLPVVNRQTQDNCHCVNLGSLHIIGVLFICVDQVKLNSWLLSAW